MREYDAELRDFNKIGGVIYGYIYNDTKGRFIDGTYVSTSLVLSKEGDIVQTKNSRYKLVE